MLKENSLTHLTAGLAMGVVGTLMYMPADVVRARAYNRDGGARFPLRRLQPLAVEVHRESGMAGVWRATGGRYVLNHTCVHDASCGHGKM